MRAKTSFLNMITSFIPFIIIGILGFLKIRFFLEYLGSEANGLIQVTYRILSYLSLAEMGLSSALIYKLYKPLTTKDYKKVSKLIYTANYFFKRVGIGIFIFSLIFMLVLPNIIKNNTFPSTTLYAVFLLAAIPYSIEYLWYKKYYILLGADQQQYKVNIIYNLSTIIYDVIIIFALMSGIGIIGYVLLSYPFVIIKGIFLNFIVNKQYPMLNKISNVDKDTLLLSKDVFIHNVGTLIDNSTDQIVLMLLRGLTFVSIYSSYYYIVKYLKDICGSILNSTVHSFGNLFADTKQIDRNYKVFCEFLSFASYLSIIISITFMILILPFINIWINNPLYLVNFETVLAFGLLIYSNIIVIPLSIGLTTNGLFKETKHYSFISSAVNIILSILLVHKFQIAGIVFATVISKILVWLPLAVRVIYSKSFKGKNKFDFYKWLLFSLPIILLSVILFNKFGIMKIYIASWVAWLIYAIIVFLSFVIIVGLLYYLLDNNFRLFVKRIIILIKGMVKNESISSSARLSE